MLMIAIDGACRRNGKPDCVSSGGVYIVHYDNEGTIVDRKALTNYEIASTNQRGELLALLTALEYVWSAKQQTCIITDSEYIFNAMTKEWFVGWESRNWLTASFEPVKNSDLWREISRMYAMCISGERADITFYHIKGHCIPFGKVTAATLLSKDNTGSLLEYEVSKKYDTVAPTRADKLRDANELSVKNNGYKLDEERLKQFVVMNTVVDAIATRCVEAADQLMV